MRPFESFLTEAIARQPRRGYTGIQGTKPCHDPRNRICPICWAGQFNYAEELLSREAALSAYWETLHAGVPLQKLRPSPLGRHYRTLSKRRWTKSSLCLLERNLHGRLEPWRIDQCDIEPLEHSHLFANLQEVVLKSPIKEGLRFAAIRGNYQRFALLLNLEALDHGALNRLTRALTGSHPSPHAIFAFQGARDSDYYLELSSPSQRLHRLHGPTWQKVDLAGRHFRYDPLAFCQVNQSLAGQMVEEVGQMLGDPELPMLDLYCGFGLFSFGTGRTGATLGVESSPWSIRSARENARYLAEVDGKKREAEFLARDLSADGLGQVVKRWNRKEFTCVLDPPRGGTAHGVIDTLAAFAPKKVVHLVCDIERTATELSRWKDAGYRLEKAVPYDMFPGTSEVELALVLSPRGGAVSQAASKRAAKGISLRMGEKSRP